MNKLSLFQTQSHPIAVTPRIATVMAALLMLQEERKTEGDEFRQEPEPEEVEDVCEVPLDQNTIRCGGAMPGRVTPVQERRAFSPGCLRDNLRSDSTLVQETEVMSIWHQCHWIVAGRDKHPDCLQPVNRSYRVRKSIRINERYQRGFFRLKWTTRVVAMIVLGMLAIENLVTSYVSSPFS